MIEPGLVRALSVPSSAVSLPHRGGESDKFWSAMWCFLSLVAMEHLALCPQLQFEEGKGAGLTVAACRAQVGTGSG